MENDTTKLQELVIANCKTKDGKPIGVNSVVYAIAPGFSVDTRGCVRSNPSKPQVLEVLVTDITFSDHYYSGLGWQGVSLTTEDIPCRASRLSSTESVTRRGLRVDIGPHNTFSTEAAAEEALPLFQKQGLVINTCEPPMTRSMWEELRAKKQNV